MILTKCLFTEFDFLGCFYYFVCYFLFFILSIPNKRLVRLFFPTATTSSFHPYSEGALFIRGDELRFGRGRIVGGGDQLVGSVEAATGSEVVLEVEVVPVIGKRWGLQQLLLVQ